MAEQKDFGDQCVVFKNTKKRENQPDYKAFITINGVKYEAGLWIKTGQKGDFLAGKVIKAGSFTPQTIHDKSSKPYQEEPERMDTGMDRPLPF